jgi:hypothetical protein
MNQDQMRPADLDRLTQEESVLLVAGDQLPDQQETTAGRLPEAQVLAEGFEATHVKPPSSIAARSP